MGGGKRGTTDMTEGMEEEDDAGRERKAAIGSAIWRMAAGEESPFANCLSVGCQRGERLLTLDLSTTSSVRAE